ncbi:hypothetical protein vnz_00050 [Streptomyces venezuelae]|nr:hypothetical protein vnz_00050 [Streptomyces venezuelae]
MAEHQDIVVGEARNAAPLPSCGRSQVSCTTANRTSPQLGVGDLRGAAAQPSTAAKRIIREGRGAGGQTGVRGQQEPHACHGGSQSQSQPQPQPRPDRDQRR